RTIDAMAMKKLNAFYWHITDAPSFLIKRTVLPFSQLAKKGAYSEKMIYTKEDIFKFINDAMSRGVHVIPEID
ncbi:glycoside hydrolase superfamily, partial [Linnemannia elongata]